ncbi:MAG: HAMP domain-containing sensor histidine kinase [Candidatus Limnocylindrales bacterium]
MTAIRTLLESFRFRLVVAFAAVVIIALALVLTSLPRLLDGYFATQDQGDLDDRSGLMATLLEEQLVLFQTLGTGAPRAIVVESAPPVAADLVFRALGTERSGYVARLASEAAHAHVIVTLAADPTDPGSVVYRLDIPLPDSAAKPGQHREAISSVRAFDVADLFWSASGADAPLRRVTVTLSDPFSYRAQTLQTIVGVMGGAAIVALIVSVIASILLAERLTTPIRRLTGASRALAEGDLDTRVPVPGSGSPEVAELATAFNAMADRLQQSITFMSLDRDRSRDFLADVSHELRTPIAALRTFNELLREGALADPDAAQEFLESSYQQIERLDWLAANLLDLSKLDSGLVALDLRPDDLRAVVEDAVAQAEPVAARKGIQLSSEVPTEPVRIRHDPPRLGQVVSNLIGNAIKFTPAGGRVSVALRSGGDGPEIVVTDTGIGIDSEELPHIFERFYRGAQASEERSAGSGLGLSIVRSIVDMHRGRISVESTPGKGTTVVVTLPRDANPPGSVAVSSPARTRS